MAFGYLKRVIVTPAVYPRLFELLHFDIQSTGQKSHCVNTVFRPSQCFVLIKQSESPCPLQFWVECFMLPLYSPAGTKKRKNNPSNPVLIRNYRENNHSSEPILFPRLRIYFADFPYLHYSIDQRLLTLETWCGYGYGPKRIDLAQIFKGHHERTPHL